MHSQSGYVLPKYVHVYKSNLSAHQARATRRVCPINLLDELQELVGGEHFWLCDCKLLMRHGE